MSVRVAIAMLKDHPRAFRKSRPDLRFAGQIGELAGLSAKTGVVITFHRSPILSELFGSRITLRCQTCGETAGPEVWPMPYEIPPGGDERRQWLYDFAAMHAAKGCRVYGASA